MHVFFCLLLSFINIGLADAQTYYYKLNSYTQSGRTSTNVSGGQFITFQGAICIETNNKGIPVGNGTLHRRMQDDNLYVGNAYWGANTHFRFNSDRSSLSVTSPDGTIYKYIRANAPSGVTTCSLIRRNSNSTSSGGAYIAPPIESSNNASSSSSSSSNSYQKKEHPKKCRKCNGSGTCRNCNGTGTVFSTTYAINKYITCPSCSGARICSLCNGTGTFGSEWY